MSLIEQDLYTHLDAGIGAVGGRVYPIAAQSGADLPYLIYSKVSGPRVSTKQGQTGLAYPVFQVAAWAISYAEVKQLANDVRKAMNTFPDAHPDGETDAYDKDTETYGCMQRFRIGHKEEI